MIAGFSKPMLLSPELADLMGETHVSLIIPVTILVIVRALRYSRFFMMIITLQVYLLFRWLVLKL